MPLRTANNPLSEAVLLNALVPVLLPNTQLAAGSGSGTGLELCYVQQRYALAQGLFPALLLSSGQQIGQRNSLSTYTGSHDVLVDYYDRWDRQTLLLDTIRSDIALDLERMKSNMETYLRDNRGLTVNSVVYPLSLAKAELSGYSKAIDTSALAGVSLGVRRLTLTFTILPYVV